MHLYLILVMVQAWLPPGLALYHLRSMMTFKPVDSSQSYFGFSMAYTDKKLIVGAPRGNDIGQVFSCDIETRDCSAIPLSLNRTIEEFKHDYWLGATLKSASAYFYTCAPRSVSSILNKYGSAGTCLKVSTKDYSTSVLSSISDVDRVENSLGKTEMASDSFGWSMDITPNKMLVIGGPAMNTGRLSIQAANSAFSRVIGLTGHESNVNFDFGYSIAIGDFYVKGTDTFAIGSPYGTSGLGKVVIYSNNRSKPKLKSQLEPKNKGVGSMFGAALCAAHISSGPKKIAALLVGAPAHANGRDYDVGAVYVYMKLEKERVLKEIRVIEGKNNGAYFGSAIANVGDLNGDHRDDVAIAAPYEAEGRGAVYVYCGASVAGESSGLEPLQRLQPRPGAPAVQGFGLALAPLPDYDENGCNELAIGAPYSDSVSLLRCFAAVIMEVDAVFPNLKGRNPAFFEFESCIKVTIPNKPKFIIGNVNVTLSIIHPDASLADSADSEYTVPLQPKHCRKVKISTPPEGNYWAPIEWKISAVLVDNPLDDEEFVPSRVLLSERSTLTRTGSIRAAECKTDVCEPNLSLAIITKVGLDESHPYIIGSSDAEVFTVEVKNTGDTAYESCVRVRVDGASLLTGSKTDCSRANDQFTCKPPASLRNNTSWLPKGGVTLDMTALTNEDTEIQIFVDLYPRCEGTNKIEYSQKIYLSKETRFTVEGRTSPEEVIKINHDELTLTGKQIQHIYTISNVGTTNWVNLEYTITLINKPYIETTVATYFGDDVTNSRFTWINSSTHSAGIIAEGRIKELKKRDKIAIPLPISIIPGKLDALLNKENLTVDSYIVLKLNEIPPQRISSTLVLDMVVVPFFIIIAAISLGLLLVAILAWALYECGFLKRKNQENLKQLKKDIRRQTIRRSMVDSGTRTQLDGVPEEAEASCTIETGQEAEDNSFKTSTADLVQK